MSIKCDFFDTFLRYVDAIDIFDGYVEKTGFLRHEL